MNIKNFSQGKAFSVLQRMGAALMLPVAILPAAGILMGIGFALKNAALVSIFPALTNSFWIGIADLFQGLSIAIFGNLPLIFAVGVAGGLANDAAAALAGLVGMMITHVTINFILKITPEMMAQNGSAYTTVLGINTLQAGPFGGIIVGFVAYACYARFHKVRLPEYLGFFSGKRLVPIMTALASIVLGIVLALVWPHIQSGISFVGHSLLNSENPNLISLFLFGFIVHLSMPFGLHHLIYPIYYYQLGTYITNAGVTVNGDCNIYFAQLADGRVPTAGLAMIGAFVSSMFIIPAISLAICHTAKPERRAEVKSMQMSGAFTSFLTGITEPHLFTYAFIAFPIWIVQSASQAMIAPIAAIIGMRASSTFTGGFIDYILSVVLPGAPKWWGIILCGIVFAPIVYFITKFMIIKFDYKTPGREDNEDFVSAEERKKVDKVDDDFAREIMELLGGKDNLVSVNACVTRLRVEVKDKNLVKKREIKVNGAVDVLEIGNNIQCIFGSKAAVLRDLINDIIAREE